MRAGDAHQGRARTQVWPTVHANLQTRVCSRPNASARIWAKKRVRVSVRQSRVSVRQSRVSERQSRVSVRQSRVSVRQSRVSVRQSRVSVRQSR
eukprot:4969268-Pleurochrysis_carterae.AAC.3